MIDLLLAMVCQLVIEVPTRLVAASFIFTLLGLGFVLGFFVGIGSLKNALLDVISGKVPPKIPQSKC